MNAFVEMRKIVLGHAVLFHRLDKVELKQRDADLKFEEIFKALENGKLKSESGIFYDGQIFDAYAFVNDSVSRIRGIHSAWHKAVKTLPDHTIVHKQDWFIKENYNPDINGEGLSFLGKSYQQHFNERPFLNHYCYLFLTKPARSGCGCRVIFLRFVKVS